MTRSSGGVFDDLMTFVFCLGPGIDSLVFRRKEGFGDEFGRL